MMHPDIMEYWKARVQIYRLDNQFGIVYWAEYEGQTLGYILAILPHDKARAPAYYLGPYSLRLTEQKALRLIKLKAFL